jgi:hypothetical protein
MTLSLTTLAAALIVASATGFVTAASAQAGTFGTNATVPVAMPHHHYYGHKGYSAYGAAGPSYRGKCARLNERWLSEPANERIQDRDFADTLGGRASTCF